jgi:hypothetical protein
MHALLFTLAAATVLAFPPPVSAQDSELYRLERTENGFVRMDVRTGEMSFCEELSGRLVCKPGADEETAEENGLEELKRRIGELEERLATLEARQPLQPGAGLPSEEEFERTMTFMERFLRRFWGVAKDLERETNPGEPVPDRT